MKKNILRISAIVIGSLALANAAYAGQGHGNKDYSGTKARYEKTKDMPCMKDKGMTPMHKEMKKEKKMHQKGKMHQYSHQNNKRYNQ